MMTGKRRASTNFVGAAKIPRKRITLDVKMQVLQRLEAGERQVDVGSALGLATSSIRTIIKNAEKIRTSANSTTPLTAMKLTRSRSSLLEKMETLLSIWVEDQTQSKMPVSQFIIMEKAKSIFNHLQQQGEGSPVETFGASRGWFDRFKRRSSLQKIKLKDEAVRADHQMVLEFPSTFKTIVKQGNYPAQLVFNVGETGLYWKRMPSRTFISREEKDASGFKASKDRLTLLLGGNASGDFKLKPLLISQSTTPRAMKGYSKEHLPVIWKSNKRTLLTGDVFEQWFLSSFCPEVKRYCQENDLESKALLVLDNTPGHPENLDSLQTLLPVKVVFLPPNTTSLFHPMDQNVISNFKLYYLRRIFKELVQETDRNDQQSVRDFWKSFNIMKGIGNISTAWEEVTNNCMNSSWKNLWPDVCHGGFKGFEEDEMLLANDTVLLANQLGMDDVDIDDVQELLHSHQTNLTNEELLELDQERSTEDDSTDDDDDDDEESDERTLTTGILTEGINKIMDAMDLFTENDAHFDRSTSVKRAVVDAISCYKEMLREKKLGKVSNQSLVPPSIQEMCRGLALRPSSNCNLDENLNVKSQE